MKKKLIIINGVMGVGKTTVSKKLYKSLPNSFWLDGDNCWMMNPFEVNEENKKMVLDNITYILNNFLNNTWSKYIIFNWVIHLDDIMNEILNRFHRDNVEINMF
jgi:predicted AAA+ superfamily ATPase